MIHINKQPGAVAYSSNPLSYELQSDNLYDTTPEKLRIEWKITSNIIPINSSISIDFTDNENNENYPITVTIPAGTLNADLAEAIVETLQDIIYFHVFDITYEFGEELGTSFLAITFAVNQDITINSVNATTGLANINNAVVGVKKANFNILLEVFYKHQGFKRATRLSATPNDEGVVNFDIQKIIHDQLQYLYTPPTLNALTYVQDFFLTYFVRYTEKYGGTIYNWAMLPRQIAHYGQLTDERNFHNDFFENIDIGNCFLTDHNEMYVGTQQDQYLAWFNYTNQPQTVSVDFNKKSDDGSSSGWIVRYDNIQVAVNQILIIPINPSFYTIAENDYIFSIRIRDNDTPIGAFSTVLSYSYSILIDHQHYENEKILLYHNQYGIPTILRTTGLWTRKQSINRELSERMLQWREQTIKGKTYQFNADVQESHMVRTGYFNHGEEARAYSDIFKSNFIYWLKGGSWTPVLIQDKKAKLGQDLDGIIGFEFELVEAV